MAMLNNQRVCEAFSATSSPHSPMNEAKPLQPLPKALINLESKDWLITVLNISHHGDPNCLKKKFVVDCLGFSCFWKMNEDELNGCVWK